MSWSIRLVFGLLLGLSLAGGAWAQAEEAPGSAAPIAAASDTAKAATGSRAGGQASAQLPHDLSPWGMFQSADIVVKAVMIGLVFASLLTWTIGFAKVIELQSAGSRLRRELAALEESDDLNDAHVRVAPLAGQGAALLGAARREVERSADALHKDGVKERVATSLQRIEVAANRRLNRGTGILATIGATAPFIGLFGTVWGIMNSFIGISQAMTTNLAVVAPGIAEALLATALGLVAAIPAVVIYNLLARAMGQYRARMGDAAAEVLRLLSRDLDRGSVQTATRLKAMG